MAGVNIRGGDRWRAALARLAAHKPELRVGILENASNSGEVDSDADATPAAKAYWNEFGGGHTPPRPFMRNTVAEKKAAWASEAARMIRGYAQSMEPEAAVDAAFTVMGEVVAKDMMQTIENGNFTPLKARTVAAKRARGKEDNPEQPLVDTGAMQEAIAFEVVSGGNR